MRSDINHFHFLQAKDVNLFYEEFTTICAVSLRLHDTPESQVFDSNHSASLRLLALLDSCRLNIRSQDTLGRIIPAINKWNVYVLHSTKEPVSAV